jgi:hypothetical protein
VAMLGGALLLGAARRFEKGPRVRDSLLLGLVLTILAKTRPYERLDLNGLMKCDSSGS